MIHIGQSKSTSIPYPNEGFNSYLLEELGHKELKGYYMFQTPCISFHSFGNRLGFYFEALLCAKKLGATFLATSLSNDTSHYKDHFFHSLPTLVENRDPVKKYYLDLDSVNAICPCNDYCHETNKSLLFQYQDYVKSIFTVAITAQIEFMKKTGLSYHNELPLIPDVALHYRCSDNSYYGIMPFKVYSDRIPANAKNIYILSENLSRNQPARASSYCKSIIAEFRSYLQKLFPLSIVSVFRGQDIYVDLARLTFANTTICSVSTYCLFPAISSSNYVYYPVSKFIASESTYQMSNPKFNWITEPMLIMDFTNQNLHFLLHFLKTLQKKHLKIT